MIKMIQLISGDHIIGDLRGYDNPELDLIALHKPAKVMEMSVPDENGDGISYTYGITRYAPFAKDNLYMVRKSSICTICEPTESIKAYYLNTVTDKEEEPSLFESLHEEENEEGLDWDEDDYDSGTVH
jgi:hypothetical protein